MRSIDWAKTPIGPVHGAGAPGQPLVRLEGEGRAGWPLAEVIEANAPRVVSDLAARFGSVPPGPWSDRPTTAVVLPIPSTRAHEPAGLLVAGVSARLRLDEQYRGFLELVAGQIGIAVANARAYEEEKKRAEALAELDRAKTAFFSNVSHEFRTPLTLMLGPVEDALADPADPLPPRQRERLETAHRSSLRLLKLVNTLLDFSRIEAGRVQAVYEPTDLAALIGLALVQELVKLHGGSVQVESTYGQGSTFTVSVPTGTAHLPADRIGAARTLGSTAVGAGAFIEEALRWLPDEETSRSFPGSVGNAREAFPPEGPAPRSPT